MDISLPDISHPDICPPLVKTGKFKAYFDQPTEACFEALFYSGYKPPRKYAPLFTNPPKIPYEDA